jgi:hypothetical protein
MANAHTMNSFAEVLKRMGKVFFFLYHPVHSSQLEQKKLLHIALGPALLSQLDQNRN